MDILGNKQNQNNNGAIDGSRALVRYYEISGNFEPICYRTIQSVMDEMWDKLFESDNTKITISVHTVSKNEFDEVFTEWAK